MSVVFERTKLLTDKQFHYCPGCNHGIIHRLVAESIDELVQEGKLEAGNVMGVELGASSTVPTCSKLFASVLEVVGTNQRPRQPPDLV